ncbi:hypothetical protein GCM10017779_53560 [Streptomyces capillispiralis]|nr:hypothetical protein GCM10017779_53560 [Streptomyces capillispiralis]
MKARVVQGAAPSAALPTCRLRRWGPLPLDWIREWGTPPGDVNVTAMEPNRKTLQKSFASSAESYAAVTCSRPPRDPGFRPYGGGSDRCARLCKHLPSVAAGGIIPCDRTPTTT